MEIDEMPLTVMNPSADDIPTDGLKLPIGRRLWRLRLVRLCFANALDGPVTEEEWIAFLDGMVWGIIGWVLVLTLVQACVQAFNVF